jgi:hypothetical protein
MQDVQRNLEPTYYSVSVQLPAERWPVTCTAAWMEVNEWWRGAEETDHAMLPDVALWNVGLQVRIATGQFGGRWFCLAASEHSDWSVTKGRTQPSRQFY